MLIVRREAVPLQQQLLLEKYVCLIIERDVVAERQGDVDHAEGELGSFGGVHEGGAHDLGESFTAFEGQGMAVGVYGIFSTNPRAEGEGYEQRQK